jgi:hypothetical protein
MSDTPVEDAVRADLKELDSVSSALGASAISLAREMDARNSATSKSMCARALIETLDRVREIAEERPKEADPVDEIKSRRDARRAQRAAASSS